MQARTTEPPTARRFMAPLRMDDVANHSTTPMKNSTSPAREVLSRMTANAGSIPSA